MKNQVDPPESARKEKGEVSLRQDWTVFQREIYSKDQCA